MNEEEISRRLGWTHKSTKLLLSRLERTAKISSRYFPIVTSGSEGDFWEIDKEISLEQGKLETMLLSLKKREKEAFEKCVQAQMARDESLASMYAGQCAEIRKLIDTVVASEDVLTRMCLALKSLRLNLKTF